MIETALQIVPKAAVEHAKDVAQGTIDDLSERLKDVDFPKLSTPKGPRRRFPWMLLLLGLVGVAAAVVVMRRRQSASVDNVAPDAFGEAVERERAEGALGQRPIATPGA
jgi:hypothetical protein